MKSLVAHRQSPSWLLLRHRSHWRVVRPFGLLGSTRSRMVTSVRMGAQEAAGAVGDGYGLLCGLKVCCLVQRLSSFDRALFVVAPAHDRIRLT